eukprot:gene19508-21437_t
MEVEEGETTQIVDEETTEIVEDKKTDVTAVNELEEEFKNRFTENDPDFMEVVSREDIPPPIIKNYLDLKWQRDRDDHSRYGRGDDRYGRRERDDRSRG